MEPEDRQPTLTLKSLQNPLKRQINRYRNSLPEVSREEGHFFFKEITRYLDEISYVTIGYQVGRVPFELHDLMAVVINCIHYSCQINLKIIMDEDNLWVTSSVGVGSQQIQTLDFRIQQAHLNQSLMKTQRIMAQFIQQVRNNPRRDDSIIMQKVKKQIVKQIYLVFKNPDLDD